MTHTVCAFAVAALLPTRGGSQDAPLTSNDRAQVRSVPAGQVALHIDGLRRIDIGNRCEIDAAFTDTNKQGINRAIVMFELSFI